MKRMAIFPGVKLPQHTNSVNRAQSIFCRLYSIMLHLMAKLTLHHLYSQLVIALIAPIEMCAMWALHNDDAST